MLKCSRCVLTCEQRLYPWQTSFRQEGAQNGQRDQLQRYGRKVTSLQELRSKTWLLGSLSAAPSCTRVGFWRPFCFVKMYYGDLAYRWRVTFHPRIVNIIISYDEGGAHDTTQYMAMVKIEFRIFAPNF